MNYQLYSQGMFFEFAVEYLSRNPDIPPDFEVREEVYQDFLRFLEDKNFEYNSGTLLEIERLKQNFNEEFASPLLEERISSLESQVHQEEKNIFQRQKEELKWRIKEAILVNHFGEKARYEKVWFQAHPEILKASELLKDKNTYNSILSG